MANRSIMDDKVRQLAEQLLKTGFDQLSDRERRVITGVAKRTQISRDANRAFEEKLTVGDRLADRVATFGGSWTFITIFLGVLVAWTLLNSVVLVWSTVTFDPYPYIFLNLILSMLAALQAPIIMMSQNRQAVRDRVAAGLDYEVNLKAELEIMALHEKLDQIRSQHLAEMLRTQQEQFQLLTRVLALDESTPVISGAPAESADVKKTCPLKVPPSSADASKASGVRLRGLVDTNQAGRGSYQRSSQGDLPWPVLRAPPAAKKRDPYNLALDKSQYLSGTLGLVWRYSNVRTSLMSHTRDVGILR